VGAAAAQHAGAERRGLAKPDGERRQDASRDDGAGVAARHPPVYRVPRRSGERADAFAEACDSCRRGSGPSLSQRNGFGSITGSTKGAGSVKDGVEFLIVVHPRCRHLIDELALYSYRTDTKTGEIQSELEDRENHAVDAPALCRRGAAAGRL
jgi:hypothetical protein